MGTENGTNRQFGRFQLDVDRRALWFEGKPVDLALKEIELLCVFTEKSGQLITKDELLSPVWADSFVEESNLSRRIYLIRKALKDFGESEEWIQTVPRRGYRFIGDVLELGPEDSTLVIEKHSVTRTLMEELPSEPVPASPLSLVARSRVRLSTVLLVTLASMAALGGFVVYSRLGTKASVAPEVRSLAVLPFKVIGRPGSEPR